MRIRSYRELVRLQTFEERFDYLKLEGVVGDSTFGFDRYINQLLYHSNEWRHTRRGIILRDSGCDLGILDREIHGELIVHHINPITREELSSSTSYELEDISSIFDPDNLITTTLNTHNALHFGDASLLLKLPVERRRNDTCLWA